MQPKDSDTRKRRILDAGILALAAAFVWVGVLYHTGTFDQKVPFTFSLGSLDLTAPSRYYDVGVKMNSTTYSAQAPIDVIVNLRLERGSEPEKVYVFFPHSYNLPLDTNNDIEIHNSGFVIADKVGNGYYRGNGKIMYPLGGCNPVYTASTLPGRLQSPDNQTAPCKVPVSGLEATTQLRANNITIALTYLIVGLTIVSMRPIWQNLAGIEDKSNKVDDKKTGSR